MFWRDGLKQLQLKIKKRAQSQQRRTRFAFFSLPKPSRVDNVRKYQRGGRGKQKRGSTEEEESLN